jgi:hypothetical protein
VWEAGLLVASSDHCPEPACIQAKPSGCVSNLWSPSGNMTRLPHPPVGPRQSAC